MKHKPEGWVVLTFQTIDSKPCYVLFCSWKNDDEWRVSSGSMVLPHLSPCGNYWIWPQISGSVFGLKYQALYTSFPLMKKMAIPSTLALY